MAKLTGVEDVIRFQGQYYEWIESQGVGSNDLVALFSRLLHFIPQNGIVRLSDGVGDPTGHAAYFTDVLHLALPSTSRKLGAKRK